MTSTSAYSRLILVTEEEYSNLNNTSKPSTTSQSHVGPDQQYRLKAAQFIEEKRKNELNEKNKEVKESSKLSDYISQISSSFTKTSIPRAISLLTFLHGKKPAFSWSQNGEIIDDGHIIAGSNLYDLLRYSTNDTRANVSIPVGWTEFKAILKKLNVVKAALSNATSKELGIIARKRRQSASPPHTPPPPRRQSITPPSSHRSRALSRRINWNEG